MAAVRDHIDRLAALTEEMSQVSALLDDLEVEGNERRQLMDRYFKALHGRLVEAGRFAPPEQRSLMGVTSVFRPRWVPSSAFRLVHWMTARFGGQITSWLSNRRVEWRRRKWRHLLA